MDKYLKIADEYHQTMQYEQAKLIFVRISEGLVIMIRNTKDDAAFNEAMKLKLRMCITKAEECKQKALGGFEPKPQPSLT